jgi:hypothetical protein
VNTFTIIVPYCRSRATVPYTLESIERARKGIDCEVILVDDGSEPSAESDLVGLPFRPDQIIRQQNQGLLFARLKGLEKARGDYTLFLDADDLIGPEKLRGAMDAFRDPAVMVVYTDTARATLKGDFRNLHLEPDRLTQTTEDMAEFFIKIQPPPHSPVFRTSFLKDLVERPLFPPLPAYNPVAEIWFYFNAAVREGKVRKMPGAETICGVHCGERITNCWEKMAVASLQVEEAFLQTCPESRETEHVRRLVGEKAFRNWRTCPFDYPAEYQRRKLQLWQASPQSRLSELGHGKFQMLGKIIGPFAAGMVMRRLQTRSYERARTLRDVNEFAGLLAQLPPAPERGH